MRLVNSQLILWGIYSLLVPQISSLSLPQTRPSHDLQLPQAHAKPLVHRNVAHAHSLKRREDYGPPRSPRCDYLLGGEADFDPHTYYIYDYWGEFAKVQLDERIGKGGQGSIWRGLLIYLNTNENRNADIPIDKPEPVAIKVAKGGRGVDSGLIQNQINSRHVMRFKEIFWSRNTRESIQVMQRGSHDLMSVAEEDEPFDSRPWITAAGMALKAAHRENIVHRDVKPENVLKGDDGVYYLIDWDLAKKVTSKSGQGSTGTKFHLGPEQKNGEKYDVYKQDVWALAWMWLLCEITGHAKGDDAEYLYEELTVDRGMEKKPGSEEKEEVPPGLTAMDTVNLLKRKVGEWVAPAKIPWMAKGLCKQDQRNEIGEFMEMYVKVKDIDNPKAGKGGKT